MSHEVRECVIRLSDAGKSVEEISRAVSLPVYDVRRVLLRAGVGVV